MLELHDISKTYSGGVEVLHSVNFTLRRGEIHTVAGENGAGKTTLFSIAGGFTKPSGGEILLGGKRVHFRRPHDALFAGIGMTRQFPSLADDLTVRENCMLGMRGGNFFLKSKKKFLCGAPHDFDLKLPLNEIARNLNLAERKKTAIYALLLRGADFFLFDEPFAHLEKHEAEELKALFLMLKNKGCGVSLIAHNIEDALSISDKLTVIKEGAILQTFCKSDFNKYTTNINLDIYKYKKNNDAYLNNVLKSNADNNTVIRCVNLSCKKNGLHAISGINIEARAGEALGIEGKRGEGIETLFLALSGFIKTQDGIIEKEGKKDAAYIFPGVADIAHSSSRALSIFDNLILHSHKRFTNKGFLQKKALRNFAKNCITESRVFCNMDTSAAALSGGSLFRLVIEREFAENAPLMFFYDALSGLDIASINYLIKKIKNFVIQGGAAIIFLDTDDALKNICNRIIKIENGKLK